MNKIRKLVIPIIIIAAALAAIVAGILFWQAKHAKAVDVYPVSNIYQTYWGDETSLSGNVTAGKQQNITLKESLINSINVKEGDQVAAGDVLMVYDTTSFQLTLQSDRARIAVLEAQIQQSKNNITKYKGLQPSENAPKPKETTIDHGELKVLDRIDKEMLTGDNLVFQCSASTVISADFLKLLRANGTNVELQMYDENTLYGSWYIDGSTLPTTTVKYIPVDPDPTPDSTTKNDSSDNNYKREEVEAITDDWTLGDSLAFNGEGVSVVLTDDTVGYGQFTACTPTEYERYEIIYDDDYTPDGSDNYVYSKAELVKMIQQEQEQLAGYELDLKSANLTLQQDELVGENGEVTATISGTVSEIKDTSTLAAGDTIFTIKGAESYAVTFYVSELDLTGVNIGDSYSLYAYESSTSSTVTVSEIGSTPNTTYYGSGNPNSSYYPITATVDDPDAQMTIGEWCEVTKISDTDADSALYLELIYVRKDDKGYYVMIADENNKLKKQYVRTGKTVWGYMIEIKSGLSMEDRVAFPYGKTVKVGAPVTDVEYPN